LTERGLFPTDFFLLKTSVRYYFLKQLYLLIHIKLNFMERKDKKRALVVGPGGMRGAYDAGAVTELFRKLGKDYFDSIYAVSAGTFISTYFVAECPETGEKIWREYVDGDKFIKFSNLFHKKNVIDLEYLSEVFCKDETILPLDSISNSNKKLIYVLTDYYTEEPNYISPTPEDIFTLMKGSAAIPFLYPPVQINGSKYIDGAISDPLPIEKALSDGHDEVIAVFNKPLGFIEGTRDRARNIILSRLSLKLKRQLVNLRLSLEQKERKLASDNRIRIIRPKKQIPLKSILDTNKERVNATINQGEEDAKRFLKDCL